jgi:arachidonate 5-lipoxygenase
MNTGRISLFATAREFILFVTSVMRGRGQEYKYYFQRVGHGEAAARDGVRRNPESYTQLYFYSQVVFAFLAKDGVQRYCRYRLIPFDRSAESGMPERLELTEVYNQRTLPGEIRSRLYLQDEWRERLRCSKARYWLQIQIHNASPTDEPEATFSPSRTWDETTHPWHDLAKLEITEALSFEENQRMVFSIAQQPPSLGLVPAYSIDDFNSINHLRARSFIAKRVRLMVYSISGVPPQVSVRRDPREERRVPPGQPEPVSTRPLRLRRRIQRAIADTMRVGAR